MGVGMAASVPRALPPVGVIGWLIGGRVICASGTMAARRLGFVPTLSRLGLTNGNLRVALSVTAAPALAQIFKSVDTETRKGAKS